MSNSLDPDKARQNVGPDLGPTCFGKGYKQTTLVDSYNGHGFREGEF